MIYWKVLSAVFVSLLLVPLHQAQGADEEKRSFQVITVDVINNQNEVKPLPKVRHTKVHPLGKGNANDIDCDDRSDESGNLQCDIISCNEKSARKRSYEIHFEEQYTYGNALPAEIDVVGCKALSSPVMARFSSQQIMFAFLERDREFIYANWGQPGVAVLTSEAFSNVYTDQLSSLLEEPLGVERAAQLRRYLQDQSALAKEDGDSARSKKYSKLLIIHSNALTRNTLKDMGLKLPEMAGSWTMPSLLRNLNAVEAGIQVMNPKGDIKAISDVTPEVFDLRKAVENGNLKTREFILMEKIAKSAVHFEGS